MKLFISTTFKKLYITRAFKSLFVTGSFLKLYISDTQGEIAGGFDYEFDFEL